MTHQLVGVKTCLEQCCEWLPTNVGINIGTTREVQWLFFNWTC